MRNLSENSSRIIFQRFNFFLFKMATSTSSGIQTLLEAEKEASKIVQVSRKYRVQRLKDARTEAMQEIEDLKAKKIKEFEAMEKAHAGSSGDSYQKIALDTEQKIKELVSAFDKSKAQVIEKLLKGVVNVQPKLHSNSTYETRHSNM